MSDTAIEALRYSEFPNSSDCISRQAAIDALNEVVKDHSITDFDAIASILDLPPAQLGTNLAEVGADCISRQKAIDEIDEWIKAFRENGHKESAADACLIQDGIIQLPPAPLGTNLTEVGTDTISRQSVIDLLKQMRKDGDMIPWEGKDVFARIRKLPSAQPEIIRCKDCKYSHMTYDGECKYCDIWFPDEAEYMDGNYYCGSAERKEYVEEA